jgi:hypothetical protein
MQFCALDDAYAFLTEAKGLPSIPSASARLHLCLRASILLAWVGLEDGLDHAAEHFGTRGRTIRALPTRLKVRMLGFLLPLSEPALVGVEFDRLRKLRNQLAHPRGKESGHRLTLDDAEQTFQFCLKMLRAINTYGMTNPARDPQPRIANAPSAREPQKMPPAKERKLSAVSAVSRKTAVK